MYEINRDQTSPVNFFAGDFPVVTEAGDVKSGATVRKYAPVIKTADGISEATADGLADLHGIAADDSTDGGVVCYLTGVTRKLKIFSGVKKNGFPVNVCTAASRNFFSPS